MDAVQGGEIQKVMLQPKLIVRASTRAVLA
jgi:hypothetical protein